MMTEAEYRAAYEWAGRAPAVLVPSGRWNKEFRQRLELSGLMLTSNRPDPLGFHIEAPWPTSGANGKPISVDEDPYSWPVPSWIVPAPSGGENE